MSIKSFPIRALVLICVTLLWRDAQAAPPSEGAVSGTGRAVIKHQPQLVRMQLIISVDGKDIADATGKLKEAKAAAAKKLADLGTNEKSIDFGPTQIGTGGDVRQQYVQKMMAMRGRGQKPAEKAKSVTLSTTLKAEWPLKAADADEMLTSAYNLQEKIKNAGLTKKDNKQLTPEEQEAMEEAQAMQAANGGSAAAPGEPSFVYVSKISDAEQTSAMADAFKHATADAAKLANAAGRELGTLAHLTSTTGSPAPSEDDAQGYARFMMRQMMGESAAAVTTPTDEAVSPQAGPLEFQITVTASFTLK
jgi:uncharacterized protein YggE